jgi:phage I-like protein
VSDLVLDLPSQSPATFADAPVGKRRALRIQIFPISPKPLAHPSGDMLFDRAFAELLVRNFRSYPGEVPADYDHGVEKGSGSPDHGLASGWVRDVKIEGDAVVAYVDPTDRATALVEAGEYRFASPTVHFDWTDPRTGKAQGPTLLSLALTNRPFIRGMRAVETVTLRAPDASPPRKENPSMETQLAETPIQTVALADHESAVRVLRDELASLTDRAVKAETEVKSLRDAADAASAAADVEAGERAGKITPATRATMIELRKSNATLFSALLEALPVAVRTTPIGVDAPAAPPEKSATDAGTELAALADKIETDEKIPFAAALHKARALRPDLIVGF